MESVELVNIEETVKARFANIARVPADKLDMEADLFKHYGLDSIKALKLISDIEVEYDIDISQEEARQICTLSGVTRLIQAKLGHA